MTPTISARVLLRRGPVFPRAVGRPTCVRRKYTKTKSGQSLEEPPESESKTIWFFGDLSAQMISISEDDSYSPSRALRSVFIGSLTSIPNYRWFMFLGQSFNYSSKLLSLATKIVVNQLVFTPLFNTYFFSMHSLLSGATFEELMERIKIAVPISWVNSCKR
ncbi:Dihydroorotate dehydrogenase (quinone), mitochondrial [Diplodia seriata]|uniref:Dihydroorotate dehydrogenase (Quinone), mitochondrial n=1 Tax=Diplodia seriata TaxID=420778 RepID=A0ABR3C2F1_9PEZI